MKKFFTAYSNKLLIWDSIISLFSYQKHKVFESVYFYPIYFHWFPVSQQNLIVYNERVPFLCTSKKYSVIISSY